MRMLSWLVLGLVSCTAGAQVDPTAKAPAASGRAVTSSAQSSATEEPRKPQPLIRGELSTDPASLDVVKDAELIRRIGESPHAYFRFTNTQFRNATCKRLGARLVALPKVRLHGDAHVEQYAVSSLGRALVDYDDASLGPAALDLVRFATSLVLAARQRAEPGEDATSSGEDLLTALFAGYRDGLAKVALPKEIPAFAKALSATFSPDRSTFLANADKAMQPIDQANEALAREGLTALMQAERKANYKRPDSFYALKKVGTLKLGIGSALGRKYLLRLEGPSAKAEDDVILELKELADRSNSPCLESIPSGAADARREQQELANNKTLLLPTLLPGSTFWTNEWLPNYEEVRIKRLGAQADLRDLAREAGLLLAAEHQKKSAVSPIVEPARLAIDREFETLLRTQAKELADETQSAYEAFRKDFNVGK
jgi:hypothetical protein